MGSIMIGMAAEAPSLLYPMLVVQGLKERQLRNIWRCKSRAEQTRERKTPFNYSVTAFPHLPQTVTHVPWASRASNAWRTPSPASTCLCAHTAACTAMHPHPSLRLALHYCLSQHSAPDALSMPHKDTALAPKTDFMFTPLSSDTAACTAMHPQRRLRMVPTTLCLQPPVAFMLRKGIKAAPTADFTGCEPLLTSGCTPLYSVSYHRSLLRLLNDL